MIVTLGVGVRVGVDVSLHLCSCRGSCSRQRNIHVVVGEELVEIHRVIFPRLRCSRESSDSSISVMRTMRTSRERSLVPGVSSPRKATTASSKGKSSFAEVGLLS